MSSMDSLSGLAIFIQAAEHRSFTAAARRLLISPSAVGKAISRLEDRLGVRLFHRSTRSVRLTAEGTLLLERGRRIAGEVEAAEAELAATRGDLAGRLRVSAPLLEAQFFDPVMRFMRLHPSITVDIDYSDRFVDIIEEGFDAVIRAGDVADSRLMSRVIGTFQLGIVTSSTYLKGRTAPGHPDELIQHDCLLHRFATSGKFERWPLLEWSNEAEVQQRPRGVVNTMDPLIRMTEAGLGIACLPLSVLRRQLDSDSLVVILEKFTSHSWTLRLMWPTARHPSSRLRTFVEFMSTAMQQA